MTNPQTNWNKFFAEEEAKDYYDKLWQNILADSSSCLVLPPADKVFSAFEVTPDKIKVVIIGQDPYIKSGQAVGRAFAVSNNVPMPPSLRNIKKELDSENVLRGEWQNDLQPWVDQGVFLLNRTLTVREGQSLSHYGMGWETFTANVIQYIQRECSQPIAYMLWGNNARKLADTIYAHPNRIVYESAHPSPLSARKGFFGNNHFALANEWLQYRGVEPIKW